jgi:hypothetical protein
MDDPIRDTLATYPQVAYALLFGSNATDRGTSFSDIDIAIGLRPGARLERQAIGRLVSDLERVTRQTVDLVLLNEAPPAVAYRVFRDGRLVFEADHESMVQGKARAMLEYLDFQPVEQLCARAVLDAAAHG